MKALTTILVIVLMQPLVAMAERDATSAQLLERMDRLKSRLLQLQADISDQRQFGVAPSARFDVYLSQPVGKLMDLDSVRLMLDGQKVGAHVYSARERKALQKGGIQPLYKGHLSVGRHVLDVVVMGTGPKGREYKLAQQFAVEKAGEALEVELMIKDSPEKIQPIIQLSKW